MVNQIIEQITDDIITEFEKPSSQFIIKNNRRGLMIDSNDQRIIVEVSDKLGNNRILKFPLLGNQVNERYVERLYELLNKVAKNKFVQRVVEDSPLQVGKYKAINSDRGIHSLKQLLDSNISQEEKEHEGLKAILDGSKGMYHIHQVEAIISDFKASNLIQYSDGNWVVNDLEMYKLVGNNYFDEARMSKLFKSRSGSTVSLPYLDYEANEKYIQVNYSTDIYSVGAQIIEILTGKTPRIIHNTKNQNGNIEFDAKFHKEIIQQIKNPFLQYVTWKLIAPTNSDDKENKRYQKIEDFIEEYERGTIPNNTKNYQIEISEKKREQQIPVTTNLEKLTEKTNTAYEQIKLYLQIAKKDHSGIGGTISNLTTANLVDAYNKFQKQKNTLKSQENYDEIKSIEDTFLQIREENHKLLLKQSSQKPLETLENSYIWGPPITNEDMSSVKKAVEELNINLPVIKNQYSLEETLNKQTHYHELFKICTDT